MDSPAPSSAPSVREIRQNTGSGWGGRGRLAAASTRPTKLGGASGQLRRGVAPKYGKVQGFVTRVGRDAEQHKHVEIFLGVPYASPPIGSHR